MQTDEKSTISQLPIITQKRQKLSIRQKAIHDEFQKYGKNAKEWMRKCVLMLPKIEKERIWEKKNFGSIYEYAAKIAGMSRDKVNQGLKILGKVEHMPELKKVIEKKGIWAVRPVLRVATPENQEFWAEKAMIMSQHTLTTYVDGLLKAAVRGEKTSSVENISHETVSNFRNGNSLYNHRVDTVKNDMEPVNKPILFEKMVNKIIVSMELDLEDAQELEKLKGKQEWNTFMKEVIEMKKQQKKKQEIEEQERLFQLMSEKPEPMKTESRHVPLKIDRFIKKRAKNMCEWKDGDIVGSFSNNEIPNNSIDGCTKPGVNIHHIEPFALTKEHDPDKLKLLCKDHHDIVHSEVKTPSRLNNLINIKFIQHKWADKLTA